MKLKMKKHFLPFILIVTMMFVGVSCDDQLDINQDPLAATQVDPNLLFPEAFVNLSNNRTIEVSGRTGNVVQYYEPAFGAFGDMALGELGNTFLVGNTWTSLYNSVLKNIVLAERTAAAQEPQNVNVIAQSKILQAFAYYNLTSMWERVPFTQALNPDEFPTPAFDEQQVVLEGIVSMIDEAIALINKDPESFRVTNGDMIFDGDLDKWEKFGNSIKLKVLMMLANKVDVSSQIAATINSPRITSLADEAAFQYFDAAGNFNPIWNTLNRFAGGINPTWWVASTTFTDVLDELNDPRKSTYYDESQDEVDTGNFGPSASPGSFNSSRGNSIVSLNILRPDYPDRYVTPGEIVLMEAEAIARGFASGDLAAADAKYREGIRLSMDFFDGKPGAISAEDKDAYLASLPALTTLSQDDAVEAIQIQIYIECFFRMPEGWNAWRRTGVPSTISTPSGSQLSGVLRRLFYPPDERGANPNAPADPALDSPMWFEN
jgi:hypothetical protein